jgi:hypothetical protein
MLDSLWCTIRENFGEADVYYTMDGGKELKVPVITWPALFPVDIPYLGSLFYYAHSGNLQGDGDEGQGEWIRAGGTRDMRGMNLYHQLNIDHFPGGGSAKLSLYVAAEKDAGGRFMFNDGQDWLLLAELPSGTYALHPRQYVQIGMVNYQAFFADGGGEFNEFHVLVTVNQTAGYRVYDCVYDESQEAFCAIPVYHAVGISTIGGSLNS